jgi:hypothetical protein
MALFNSKYRVLYSVLVVFIILFILIYSFTFKKQKGYYFINNIEIKVISFLRDSLKGERVFTVTSDKINILKDWGVSIKISKKYVEGPNSKRYLLGGSMEPGIYGIKSKLDSFKIALKCKDKTIVINDYLITKEISSNSSENLGDIIYELNKNKISLTEFINDINNNAKYTRGISLSDSEIYFWVSPQISIPYSSDWKLFFQIKSKELNFTKEI